MMDTDDKEVVWIDHRAIRQYVDENEPMNDLYLDSLSTRDTSKTPQSKREQRDKKLVSSSNGIRTRTYYCYSFEV